MRKVIVLLMEAVYLSMEASGRFSPTKDSSVVSETVHHTPEAIATHGSTDPNMLGIIIACHAMILVLHERKEGVVDPPSRRVMMMVLVVPFRRGVILLTLAAAGHSTSWRYITSSRLVT